MVVIIIIKLSIFVYHESIKYRILLFWK